MEKSGSGGDNNGAPMRKWPGVRAQMSLGFSLIGLRGLELRHASILESIVVNSSKVKNWAWVIFFKWDLTLFTPASQSPPIWGAPGGLKCQSILWKAFWERMFARIWGKRFSWFFRKMLAAPTNAVPLSENRADGVPRREKNRENAAMKLIGLPLH